MHRNVQYAKGPSRGACRAVRQGDEAEPESKEDTGKLIYKQECMLISGAVQPPGATGGEPQKSQLPQALRRFGPWLITHV
ncbi:hypothetical protein SS05631_c39560 [Sinorhizobium sp. CCBAU 05631]|nr:hypothetical protein SS05631_c39560 [Sinorhizobium sp. CCBAU 05631]